MDFSLSHIHCLSYHNSFELVGAINMPLSLAVDIAIIRQVPFDRVCLLDVINVCLMHTFSWASLYHLTVVAWERYVAIRKWMDYKVIATKKQAEKARDNCLVLSCVNRPSRRYTCGTQSGS